VNNELDIKTMKHPGKLTRTVLQYPGMILRLHVALNSEKYHFHNNYNSNILDININGFLTLEVPKNEENANNRSFMIGVGNIGTVVNAMKKVLKSIYDEPMFVNEDKKVVLDKELAIKHRQCINIPRLSQGLIIIPAVIEDDNEVTYEGVFIYVNKMSNLIKLSIDEYENLVHVLDRSDITLLSQSLLNYYISFISGHGLTSSSPHYDNNTYTTKTISNFRPKDDYNVFSELNQTGF